MTTRRTTATRSPRAGGAARARLRRGAGALRAMVPPAAVHAGARAASRGASVMAPASAKSAKYVYGVVRADGRSRPRAKGIGEKQIKIVDADGLGALTSDVPPGDLEAGREELMAHSRVLERAIEQGAVLAMQFGVVMPDESAVREQLLDPHRGELEAQLEEMEDKFEVNLKAIYDERALLSEVIDEQPEVAKLREAMQGQPEEATHFERIRLGELVAGAVDEKRDRDADEILRRLANLAVAV